LFSFRKIKQLYFPSLQFIQHVEQESRSTKKLKHLLILISRILAFIALVFAFTQPYLPANGSKISNGKPVLAIYIDNSLSMTAKGNHGELLSEAAEIARDLIENVSRSTRILLTTNEMTGADARLLSKEQALDRIDQLAVSGYTKTPAEVIAWQKDCIKREHETTERLGQTQFVVISDFQKSTIAQLTKIKETNDYVYPIKLASPVKENLSIDSVWFESPVHRKGSQNAIRVRVRNYSENPISNLDVSLQLGALTRSLFLDIPANKSAELAFQFTETQTGPQNGVVSINDKRVAWDDDYYFSYQAFTSCAVLVVSPSSASLCKSIYSLEPYYKVESCTPESINSNQLAGKDLVVLDGVTRLSSTASSALTRYSDAGGAVCFIPDQEIDLLSCNYLLRNLGLPALGDKTSSGVSISKINDEAPFFKGVFDKKIGRVSFPTIKSCFRSLVSTKTACYPLITLQNGSALLSQSANGKRNFLLSVPLHEAFGSFTKDALFPTVMLRIGEISKPSLPTSLILGTESFVQLNTNLSEDEVIRMHRDSTTFIPKRNKNATGETLFFSGEEILEYLKPGSYALTAKEQLGFLSFNYNRQESEPSYADQEAIESYFKRCGINRLIYNEQLNGRNLPPIDVEKPYDYWRICIVLALIFVFAEMALVLFWKK